MCYNVNGGIIMDIINIITIVISLVTCFFGYKLNKIIISKIIHGNIAGKLHQGKYLPILLPQIGPVAVLHGAAVEITPLQEKLRGKGMDNAFRSPVAQWLFPGDAF